MSDEIIEAKWRRLDSDEQSFISGPPIKRQVNGWFGGWRMDGVGLDDFIRRSTKYSQWHSRFTPSERRGVEMGSVGMVIGCIALIFVGKFADPTVINRFWFFSGLYAVWVSILLTLAPVIFAINAILLTLLTALWQMTGMTIGVQHWHTVASIISTVGLLNLIVVVIPVALIAINLLTWLAFFFCAGMVIISILSFLAAMGVVSMSMR